MSNLSNRVQEIISQITAFSKEEYKHEELLPELLELQKQLVALIFDKTHAELSRFRIWDVENHIRKMNDNCKGVNDEELSTLLEDCKQICNMIKSEFSGQAGERKAFWSLEAVRCKKTLLKNVEFTAAEHRTELDGILVTEKAIFIIEVKNPGKDIYIDERGNYCRVGQTMVFDKNIGEKMNDKEVLLKKALANKGYAEPKIESIVVFTNNAIKVDNNFPYIKTCFLSDIRYIIENYDGNLIYNDEDIASITAAISEAETKESYPLPIDFVQFKTNFASVVAKLEKATAELSDDRISDEMVENNEELDCKEIFRSEECTTLCIEKTNIKKAIGIIGITAVLVGVVTYWAKEVRK